MTQALYAHMNNRRKKVNIMCMHIIPASKDFYREVCTYCQEVKKECSYLSLIVICQISSNNFQVSIISSHITPQNVFFLTFFTHSALGKHTLGSLHCLLPPSTCIALLMCTWFFPQDFLR
jgi:hypothetical protein